jgi:UDP-N-acetylmuramoylalanine--D-glutamate ligase
MVVSPGVPQNSKVIRTALEKKIDVISEIELGSWFCKGKIVSITGTNGKTTTTTMIGEICKGAGLETFVCGNIGTAFCDVAENIKDDSIAVIETSSFQLDNIKYFKPMIALLLNITPDHLDRYNHRIGDYINSKHRVYETRVPMTILCIILTIRLLKIL